MVRRGHMVEPIAMPTVPDLLSDVAALRAMIAVQAAEIAAQKTELRRSPHRKQSW